MSAPPDLLCLSDLSAGCSTIAAGRLSWATTPSGNKNVQTIAPAIIAEASGTQYFRHVAMTWSIRSRGRRPAQPDHARHAEYGLGNEIAQPSRLPIQAAIEPTVFGMMCRSTASMPRSNPGGQRDRAVPSAEEQHGGQPTDDEHRRIFGHEENHPAKAGILGEEAGHQFALGLGQVERRPIGAGRGTGGVDPKRAERERIVEDVPVA